MTHHNIVRSEAGRPIAHVNIRESRAGRRRPKVSFVVGLHLATLPIGGGAALIDGLIIGQPVCFTLMIVGYAAWCVWPSR